MGKSLNSMLNSLGHFLIFDLTKLGAAYQMINSFADEQAVRVFEVSPVGTQAVLILMSKDLISAQLVYSQCLSLYRSDVLASALVENVDDTILNAYLSQQKPALSSNLLVVEAQYFSKAFEIAKRITNADLAIVDFRAVRTSPANLIITSTSSSAEKLNQFMSENGFAKMTLIPEVQPVLKAYFEILG